MIAPYAIVRRARRSIVAISLVLFFLPAAALTQTANSGNGQIISLTPEQKADLLARNTEATVDAARAQGLGGAAHQEIHGEVGAMIGSGGTRGVFGTAAIPLGDDAGAIISFENSRFSYPR